MNMFFLDSDPIKAAQQYCDTHNSKIILEIAQCLCTALWVNGIEAPYKPTHKNHPVSKWTRNTRENWQWTLDHVKALLEEKIKRTNVGHKSYSVIESIKDIPIPFPSSGLEKFPVCIADDKKCRQDQRFTESDPVLCYKLYYIYDKAEIAKWKNSEIPNWFLTGQI